MKIHMKQMALLVLSALMLSACTNTPNDQMADSQTITNTTTHAIQTTELTNGKDPGTSKEPYTVLEGKLMEYNDRVQSGKDGVVALANGEELTNGSFSADVIVNSDQKAALIFGYSKEGSKEQYYRFGVNKSAQRVELELVTNGKAKRLYSNYLSAGYGNSNSYPYRVVIEDSTAYCYFWNTLYAVQNLETAGSKVGVYAESGRATFKNISVTEGAKHDTPDTLIYGHSYMEMWNNWKNDIKGLQTEFALGTVMNAGIGGSVASHWYQFRDSLVAYGSTKGIYMIGINDLTGGTSPTSVISSIQNTLLYVKEQIPEYEVVLLSVNHCNARSNIRPQISETNRLMRELCAQYDWISYAEVEYAFCDDGVNPASRWFIDGLHPSAAGYQQKLIPAIRSALLGENQPTLNDDLADKLLQDAKNVKLCQLTDYRESAFRSAEWAVAKPLYDAAVGKINNCKTVAEVVALDLSAEIAQLDQIKNVGDYSYEELISGSGCEKWETDVFKNALESGQDGSFLLTHDGHRLNTNTLYTDMTFKFKLSDVTGAFDVAGPLFRARQSDALGIQGYMINFVTEPNYIQIWYFEECFGTANKNMHYIGGWVFPGEVEDTEFRAVVEGNTVYIYTEEDYQTKGKDAFGCSADLSYGGQLPPYAYGAYGVLCWNSNTGAKGTFAMTDIQGTVYLP